jgi:hypothetical protein
MCYKDHPIPRNSSRRLSNSLRLRVYISLDDNIMSVCEKPELGLHRQSCILQHISVFRFEKVPEHKNDLPQPTTTTHDLESFDRSILNFPRSQFYEMMDATLKADGLDRICLGLSKSRTKESGNVHRRADESVGVEGQRFLLNKELIARLEQDEEIVGWVPSPDLRRLCEALFAS